MISTVQIYLSVCLTFAGEHDSPDGEARKQFNDHELFFWVILLQRRKVCICKMGKSNESTKQNKMEHGLKL